MRCSRFAPLLLLLLGACGYGNADPSDDGGASGDAGGNQAADVGPPVPYDAGGPNLGDDGGSAFTLRGEWTGPCHAASGAIDVNLGNSPESFVAAAYCQIAGTEPSPSTISNWAGQLRTLSYVRRIDVVRTLCQQAGKTCALTYSDPWLNDPPLTKPCARTNSRDVGAVMMFFFGCPGKNNCGMDWANTHAYGMASADPIYGFGGADQGYYAPTNTGFWLRELLDARYAGLQFMLPNVYGFDIQPSTGEAQNLEAALTTLDGMGGGIQVGLFNDTWAWGESAGGSLMNPAPSLSDTSDAAQRLYDVEWKPFFSAISKPHWYTVNGAPLIYFYNAGTLTPTSGASAVVARLKTLFAADFGVTPFVVVDRGYGNTASADAMFTWDTFTSDATTHLGTATSTTGNLTFDSSMVKWDSLGRDEPGVIATSTTKIFKSPDILEQVLAASTSANYLLLETWNDLGEGTGMTRNYDYYVNGSWLPPTAFMDAIRASQCSN